jgi:superfamily I DNA/RNA helicase
VDATWWRSPEEVDEDQMRVYSAAPDGRFLVTGPPGSGKTNVLLLRAIYLTRAGRANIRVLTLTRTLTEFIRSGASAGGKIPAERIQTVIEWQRSLYRQLTGEKLPYGDEDFDTQRTEMLAKLTAAVKSAGLRDNYYDCLLIDEVQDLWKEEVELLGMLSRNLFLVGDARQRIYARNEGMAAARGLQCQELALRYHYRIGRKICEVGDRILPDPSNVPLSKFSQYDELRLPSSAKLHTLPSMSAQANELIRKVDTQLRAYPEEWIGVIAPRNKDVSFIHEQFQKTPLANRVSLHDEDSREFNPQLPIVLLTAHSSKGTEFRAVHFFAADEFGHRYTREKAFTVVTRAKTSLDVYHTGPIDGSLQGALSPERVPDPKEVF